MSKSFRNWDLGASLLELLTAVALFVILSEVVVSNIKQLHNPLADAGFEVSHFLRLARARAISQTLAIEVWPASATQLTSTSRSSCTDETDSDAPVEDLVLDLPDGTSFSDTDWSVCFTQRGLAYEHTTFELQGGRGNSKTVEVALGGGVRIQ